MNGSTPAVASETVPAVSGAGGAATFPTRLSARPPAPAPGSASVPAAPVVGSVAGPPPGPPGLPAVSGVSGGSGRLRNGELRRLVARFLAGRGGDEFTPGDIARALGGRSAGAVGNALVFLTARGEAVQTCARPLRYRATPTTATAAAATGVGAGVGAVGGVRAGAASGASPGSGRRSRPGSSPAPTTAAGAVPVGVGVVSGPVARPNGQSYHPRTLAGVADVTALRRLRAAGVPALLYGPPGTGKTSVIEAAFPDLVTVPGDGDTTVADLVGEYTQTPQGRYVFVHGPLVRAMREGRALFLDDATLIPPSVLAVAYPAMDGRRQITVKANAGETVTAADGFYVVAGHNPGVHGAVLTDALSSRFSAQIQVSTDYDLAAQLRVDKRAVRVARNLATRMERGEVGWAPQLRELLAFQRITDVLGVEAATANLVGIAPEDDRDTVASIVRGVFGAPVTPLALGTRI